MNTNNSNPADADGNYQYTLPLQTTKFAIFGLLQSGQLATQAIININDLLYSLRIGRNAFEHTNGFELFEYLQNPNDAKIFNNAMTTITSLSVSLISSMYDFSQFNTVDIGQGQGHKW